MQKLGRANNSGRIWSLETCGRVAGSDRTEGQGAKCLDGLIARPRMMGPAGDGGARVTRQLNIAWDPAVARGTHKQASWTGVAVAVAAARSSHQQLLRPRWMTTGAHENRVAVQPWGPRQPCSSGLSPFELARMPSCCTDRRKNLGLRPLLGLDVTREPHGQECSVGSSQSLRSLRASECQPTACLGLRVQDIAGPSKLADRTR